MWVIFHFETGTRYADEHYIIELTHETIRDVTQILADVFGVRGCWMFSYQSAYLSDPTVCISALPNISNMALISVAPRPVQTVKTLRGFATDVHTEARPAANRVGQSHQNPSQRTTPGRLRRTSGPCQRQASGASSSQASSLAGSAQIPPIRTGSGRRRARAHGTSPAAHADEARVAVRAHYEALAVERKADFDKVRWCCPNVNQDELLGLFITMECQVDATLQLASQ
jgi:hypothetical protein